MVMTDLPESQVILTREGRRLLARPAKRSA